MNDFSFQLSHDPVIFIHGNSDSALTTAYYATGWESSIAYFLQQGYSRAELYATSWGDNVLQNSGGRYSS